MKDQNGFMQSLRAHLYVFWLALAIFVTAPASAGPWDELKRIDARTVTFGHEPTFQDEVMFSESGGNDVREYANPHKRDKLLQFIAGLIGLFPGISPRETTQLDITHKPFVRLTYPDEVYKLNMEPGVIEANITPKTIFNIKAAWQPVFQVANKTGLTHAVGNLGEGGGGGHLHVGGATKINNPFLLYPNLLRNLLVYTHQHPSLLYGFAEAYDVGRVSSYQTMHAPGRQERFAEGIQAFDEWWKLASPETRRSEGLRQLLQSLSRSAPILFQHDVFINLQHAFQIVNTSPENFKATVEWRNIRPLASADEVEAMAGLLLRMMDHFSDPELLVPFRMISPSEYRNFFGTAYTAADWEKVKVEVGIQDSRLDDMMLDYTSNSNLVVRNFRNGHINETYSERENRGDYVELTMPVPAGSTRTSIRYRGNDRAALPFTYDGQNFLSAVVDMNAVRCEKALARAIARTNPKSAR